MLECPPRFATPRTPSRKTLGGTAAKIAIALNQPLMPWQQLVADTCLELDDDGNLVYREVILTVGRQAGKTFLVLVILLVLALRRPNQRIVFTQQDRNAARQKLTEDWLPLLEPTRFANEFTARLANGSEALRFNNGSRVGLIATTKKSGHGSVLDAAVVDEAFAQQDSRLEISLKPAMMTRPDPMLFITSAAGTPQDSPYLLEKVQRGREIASAGINTGVCYFEWGAEDGADPADPATWRAAMPALGRTVTEEAVQADFLSMDLSDFRRSFLNEWVVSMTDPVIPLVTWDKLADHASKIIGRMALALDVSPDRSRASIAAAGKRADGKHHVEIVEQGAGTQWLARRVAELVKAHDPCAVVLDAMSPAASLKPELERLGVDVVTTSAQDAATACALFYDAATSDNLRHLGNSDLRDALEGATKRRLGDQWAWSRRSSNVDITCLVAATLALWGEETQMIDPEPEYTRVLFTSDLGPTDPDRLLPKQHPTVRVRATGEDIVNRTDPLYWQLKAKGLGDPEIVAQMNAAANA